MYVVLKIVPICLVLHISAMPCSSAVMCIIISSSSSWRLRKCFRLLIMKSTSTVWSCFGLTLRHIFHKLVSFLTLRPRSLLMVSFWSRWSFWVSFWSHIGLIGSHFGHQIGLIWSLLGLAQGETKTRPKKTQTRPSRPQ